MHTNPKSLNGQPYILGVEQAGAEMPQELELKLSDADWHRIGGGLERLLTPAGPQRLLEMQHLCAYLLQLIAYSSHAPAYLTGGYWEHQGANLPPVFENSDGRISSAAQNRAILALARHIVSRINAQSEEFAPLARQSKDWPTLAPVSKNRKRGRGRPFGANSIRTSRISPLVRKIDSYRTADKTSRETGRWIEHWCETSNPTHRDDPWGNFFQDRVAARQAYRFEFSFYTEALVKPQWFRSAASLPPLRSSDAVIERWLDVVCELIQYEYGNDYIGNPTDPKLTASRQPLNKIFDARDDSVRERHLKSLEYYLLACRRFGEWPTEAIASSPQPDQVDCAPLLKNTASLREHAICLPDIPMDGFPASVRRKRNPHCYLEESETKQLRDWWRFATPAACQWLRLIDTIGRSDTKFRFLWSRPDISSIGQTGEKLKTEIKKVLVGLAKDGDAKRV